MTFKVSEKYRLEIHWTMANYNQEGVAMLGGCYLSGPVIKEVDQMNQRDFMVFDFTNQYKIFTKDYYIATFSWEGVRHTPDVIYLDCV
jgi:hypothetical protein